MYLAIKVTLIITHFQLENLSNCRATPFISAILRREREREGKGQTVLRIEEEWISFSVREGGRERREKMRGEGEGDGRGMIFL